MSRRKVLVLALALMISGGGLHAQKILVGADFETRFDNREYANNDFNESRTLFSARLTPRIGIEWQEKNQLVFGVEMLQNFGQYNPQGDPFLSDVKPLMYYRFKTENVQANAGIFNRKELSEGTIEDAIVHNQIEADIRRLIKALPNSQREVLIMRYYKNMSFKEIADHTQVSINTALGRMRYAILNLRKMAEENNIVLTL